MNIQSTKIRIWYPIILYYQNLIAIINFRFSHIQ